MKPTIFLDFLTEGFSLAKRSLDIFLISLPFSLYYFLEIFIGDSLPSIFSLLNFPVFFLSIAFSMSLPVFLRAKQLKGKENYKEIFLETLRNSKRLFLPSLLIIFIAVVFLLALVVAIYSIHPLSDAQVQEFGNTSLIWWQIFFAVLSIFLSIFEFTAVYFSLEKRGLFESMKRSVLTAFKNSPYLFYLILINVMAFLLALLVPAESQIGQLVISLVSFLITFILTCATLIYYQKVIKKD